MFFEPLQGWGLHHCPGQPFPVPDHSFSKEIFPNIRSKPPLTQQLEAIMQHEAIIQLETINEKLLPSPGTRLRTRSGGCYMGKQSGPFSLLLPRGFEGQAALLVTPRH